MCGRFTQERPTSDLAEIFEAEDLVGLPGERFNVAPTDPAVVVVQRQERRAVTAYRWGLTPHWAASPKGGARMINARAETILQAPAFRDAFRRKRCLVPVDSFYEWRREGSIRQPFRIHRPDGRPFALAGVWDGWHDPETEEVVRSFSIVTTGPNEVTAPIHDRMPVVLTPETWDRWLDPELPDPSELVGLLIPADDDLLEAYRVSRAVNDIRNDSPGLILPLEEAPGPLVLPFA